MVKNLQSRSSQEQRIIEGIFTGVSKQSSLEQELLAVECAQNRPDAIPWQRASEIYLDNAMNGYSDLAQAALWCIISGKNARMSDEVLEMHAILTSAKSKWETRAEVIEELAVKAAGKELTAPSFALLQRMYSYVSENKALQTDRNRKTKRRIQEALSDVLSNQHNLYTDSTPNERFANALKNLAKSKGHRFEILTEAYSMAEDYAIINKQVLAAGRALTAEGTWNQKAAEARKHLAEVQSLNSTEEAYLRNALLYLQSNSMQGSSPEGSAAESEISRLLKRSGSADDTIPDAYPAFLDSFDSNIDDLFPNMHHDVQTIQVPSARPIPERAEPATSIVHYSKDNVQVIVLSKDKPQTEGNKPLKVIDVTEYVQMLEQSAPVETPAQDDDYRSFLFGFIDEPAQNVPVHEPAPIVIPKQPEVQTAQEIPHHNEEGTAVILDRHGNRIDFDKPLALTEDGLDQTYLLTRPKNREVSWSGRIIMPIEKEEETLTDLVEKSGSHRVPENPHDKFLEEYSGSFSIPLIPQPTRWKSAIAAGALTLLIGAGGVGVIAWASSTGSAVRDYKIPPVTLKNPVIIVDQEEKQKLAEPQISQEEQDKKYCDEQLLGKNHDTSGRGVLAQLRKADLAELTQACFIRQVRGMVDANFMKGTDFNENYRVLNQPYSLNNIYARTFMIEYQDSEGHTESMPITFFDPLGARSSKIMSQWNAPRGGVYERDEEGNITGCKPGQYKTKMAARPDPKKSRHHVKKSRKKDTKEAKEEVVDATDIPPAASIDTIAADAAKSQVQPEDKSADAINEAGEDKKYDQSQSPAPSGSNDAPKTAQSPAPSSNPAQATAKPAAKQSNKPASNVNYSCHRYHGGFDLVDKSTTWKDFTVTDPMIYAPLPGRIRMILKNAKSAGNYVQTEHVLPNGKKILFEYMHMGAFSPWVEDLFQKHRKGNMAVFKSGEGAPVYPFVFNTLVSYVSDPNQLTDQQSKQYRRFGVSLGEMGHSGNADAGAEHLHLQFKIVDEKGNTKLVNPELILPVLQKGLGLQWSEDYAEILDEMAELSGLDAEFLQEIRAHESDRMESVSSANAYGFMQLRQNGAGWGASQTYIEKSRLEKVLKELETKKADTEAKGEKISEDLEDRLDQARTNLRTITYFANSLNEKGSWRRIKNDPFANMFAGVMTAKANYVFFGGTIYQQELKKVYEAALQRINKDGNTKKILLEDLESGKYKVKVNRLLTEDYGLILAREVEQQFRNIGHTDAKKLLEKAYESALENMHLDMYRRTASGYNAGHGATLNAIEMAQKKDQLYRQQMDAAAKSADVETYNQLRDKRERNHWSDFIYNGTRAYAQGIIEGMIFRASYTETRDDSDNDGADLAVNAPKTETPPAVAKQ
ncbi:hypothetical protein KY363_01385 [Candidatus Woesearchaeota archaeon]|nr:hypothetical protein [Candidatus Woesearchaeota archaeon]